MALPGKQGGTNEVTAALKDLPRDSKLSFIYGVTQRRKEPYRVDNTHKRYKRMWPREAKAEFEAERAAATEPAEPSFPEAPPPEGTQKLAAWWRMVVKFTQYERMRRAQTEIGSTWRRHVRDRRYVALQVSALRLATWWRARRIRLRYLQLYLGTVIIQRWWSPYLDPDQPPPPNIDDVPESSVESEADSLEDMDDLDVNIQELVDEVEDVVEEEESEEDPEKISPGMLAAALDGLNPPRRPFKMDPHFRELGEYYWNWKKV